MKYPAEEPGLVVCRECKIQAFYQHVALESALVEAHKFAKENNIPFYRVEPKEEA
jgi:hypothetical protein